MTSNWVGKSYYDIQYPILTFELSRKIVFWHSKSYFDIRTNWVGKSYFDISKSYFDIRTESENCILTFKILFNPILPFELSRKILFWHSKSYFDIRTESENRIFIFKILIWHSNWVGKWYFDIQNPILTFEMSRKVQFQLTVSIWP